MMAKFFNLFLLQQSSPFILDRLLKADVEKKNEQDCWLE